MQEKRLGWYVQVYKWGSVAPVEEHGPMDTKPEAEAKAAGLAKAEATKADQVKGYKPRELRVRRLWADPAPPAPEKPDRAQQVAEQRLSGHLKQKKVQEKAIKSAQEAERKALERATAEREARDAELAEREAAMTKKTRGDDPDIKQED